MLQLLAFDHYTKQDKFFSSETRFAILFSNDYDGANTYVYCDNDILCYRNAADSQSLPVEVIMQKNNECSNNNYIQSMYSRTLNENEIVLSESIAKKYSIDKGDEVYLDVGYLSYRVSYTVADIVEDTPAIFGDADRMLALVGYLHDYDNSLNVKTLFLFDGKLSELTFESNYLGSVDFRAVAQQELLVFLSFLFVYLIILSVVLIVALFLTEIEIHNLLFKLKRLGYLKSKIIMSKLLINLIVMLPIIIIPSIMLAFSKNAWLLLGINSLLVVICMITCFIIDYKYYANAVRRR
jgi:hypothetical protein